MYLRHSEIFFGLAEHKVIADPYFLPFYLLHYHSPPIFVLYTIFPEPLNIFSYIFVT